MNVQIDKFVYRSDLETTNLAYFPSKSLNYTAINFFLQKFSTLTIVKFTISRRTNFTLQTSVKYLKAITMCSAFTPDCGYDNSTIILIGEVYCPNTKCSGKFCLHKKTSISRRKRLSMPAMRVCVSGAQYSFWRSNKLLFVVWSRGLHFWRESRFNSRCYWRRLLSWQVLFQQRELRISWRLCNNSEIHFWLWKLWGLIVCSQSSFYVTRARKDDKNRQNTLFSLL